MPTQSVLDTRARRLSTGRIVTVAVFSRLSFTKCKQHLGNEHLDSEGNLLNTPQPQMLLQVVLAADHVERRRGQSLRRSAKCWD